MTPTEKKISNQAKSFAAQYVGVSKSFVEKCIRGERDSATSETVMKIYREKVEALQKVMALPTQT